MGIKNFVSVEEQSESERIRREELKREFDKKKSLNDSIASQQVNGIRTAVRDVVDQAEKAVLGTTASEDAKKFKYPKKPDYSIAPQLNKKTGSLDYYINGSELASFQKYKSHINFSPKNQNLASREADILAMLEVGLREFGSIEVFGGDEFVKVVTEVAHKHGIPIMSRYVMPDQTHGVDDSTEEDATKDTSASGRIPKSTDPQRMRPPGM